MSCLDSDEEKSYQKEEIVMQYKEILKKLKAMANPEAVAGMARFGINPENTYGISIPNLRRMAKEIGKPPHLVSYTKFDVEVRRNEVTLRQEHRAFPTRCGGKDHRLAQQLWDSGIHEARILAGMIDEPERVTGKQMEEWVRDFDSWDVCDQVCMNLFEKTGFAYQKAVEWSKRDEEFVKRAGFVLMAVLSVHDKEAEDEKFLKFFPLIKRESNDSRNFVKKAVNPHT